MTEKTRERIYRYIKEQQQTITVAPTVREIMRAVGLNTPSAVNDHVDRLIRQGRLVKHIEGRRLWFEFPTEKNDEGES